MDFSTYSIEQLQSMKGDIDKEIERQKNAKRRNLMSDIERLARDAGVSLDDLFGSSAPKKKAKAPVAAKYRNPNDLSQTWSGRGRQPLWLAALLAEGNTLDSLAI